MKKRKSSSLRSEKPAIPDVKNPPKVAVPAVPFDQSSLPAPPSPPAAGINVKGSVKALCTSLVVQGEKDFLANMGLLGSKDYCDVYLRLLALAQKESSGESASAPIKGVTNLINSLSVNLLKQ